MSERILFFPDRFKDASRFYATGRPTYPKLLARRVAAHVALAPEHDVLDLGTGPGFLAIDFAPLSRTAVGLDPSPEMLAVAAENARGARVSVRFVQGSSYELSPSLGQFQLVTIGRAFHWMDRVETLALLDGLVNPRGAVALFADSFPEVPANAWRKEFQELVDRFSPNDTVRPQIRAQRAAVPHEAVLLDSVFDRLERISVFEERRTPIARFVDRALSFGSVWEGRTSAWEAELAREVQRVLGPYADQEGRIREVIEGQALIAQRSRDLDN